MSRITRQQALKLAATTSKAEFSKALGGAESCWTPVYGQNTAEL